MDDIPFSGLGRLWKPIFGCQHEFIATDKYCRKKRIYWGKPFIWLINADPRFDMDGSEREYLEGNAMIYTMGSSEKFY